MTCERSLITAQIVDSRLRLPRLDNDVVDMLAAWVSSEVEAKFLDAIAAEDFEFVNLTV